MRSLLAVLAAILAACTTESGPCSPSNCHTCCDDNEKCVAAVSAAGCGDKGFHCSVCGAGESCVTGGQCHITNSPDGGLLMRAFVTKASFTGDLKAQGAGASGLEGGDKLCQTAASAASLPGTFKAWLSDS